MIAGLVRGEIATTSGIMPATPCCMENLIFRSDHCNPRAEIARRLCRAGLYQLRHSTRICKNEFPSESTLVPAIMALCPRTEGTYIFTLADIPLLETRSLSEEGESIS